MLIENETKAFKELLHGVVFYMRSFICTPTQCITIHVTCDPNSDMAKYVLPAMRKLERLGLGTILKLSNIQYQFCKISATTYKNMPDLQYIIKSLCLNAERVAEIFEAGEQRRYQ